jgi:hypothetical protein
VEGETRPIPTLAANDLRKNFVIFRQWLKTDRRLQLDKSESLRHEIEPAATRGMKRTPSSTPITGIG